MTLPVTFPKTWPTACPPQDAVNADGEVYRIVDHDPPVSADLASHFETGRLPRASPCLRCGVSVFREPRDAEHQRSLMPKLGRWISKGALHIDHGKTKLTAGHQPTHTTWWAYEGVNRAGLFTIVREEA